MRNRLRLASKPREAVFVSLTGRTQRILGRCPTLCSEATVRMLPHAVTTNS